MKSNQHSISHSNSSSRNIEKSVSPRGKRGTARSHAEQTSLWMQTGLEQGWIRTFERSLVAFLEREYGRLSEDLVQAVCLLSLMENEGHSLLPLWLKPSEYSRYLRLDAPGMKSVLNTTIRYDELQRSPFILDLDSASELQREESSSRPLILKGKCLSFRRIFTYEREIEHWFREQMLTEPPADNTKILQKLNDLFPDEENDARRQDNYGLSTTGNEGSDHNNTRSKEVNWKRVALILSLYKPCMIISGGPGTGKTTTIASMIRLHQELTTDALRIALAAPTGKAAGRMSESLRTVYDERGWRDQYIDELMSAEAFTLHRLLQKQESSGLLLQNRKSYLPYDLVIVDEASMIDLNLMHRLISQIGPGTRLILLGDKDQLVSVEAGSVFSDLCTKKDNHFSKATRQLLENYGIRGIPTSDGTRIPDDSIVYLTKSYRFNENSGIGSMAAAIKRGESRDTEIRRRFDSEEHLAHVEFRYEKEEIEFFMNRFRERVQAVKSLKDPGAMIQEWKKEIWLTVLRRGPNGSDLLNRMMEESYLSRNKFYRKAGWYHGRYIIITKNDYALGVYNGDTGVCVDQGDGSFTVYIESGSTLKPFHPDRLKEYKPAYFLTVHKSQGSEFHHVRLLLPLEDTPVLTKELVYTAVTRSREKFTLHGDLKMFSASIQKAAVRFTGLFQGV